MWIISSIIAGLVIVFVWEYITTLVNRIKTIQEDTRELHKKINYIHRRLDIEYND